jgi:hypothetical protein
LLEFIGFELDHTPKREFAPDDLFYNCANIKKTFRARKVFVLRAKIELSNSVSRLGRFSHKLLND